MVELGGKEIISEVPKRVRELDEKLGIVLFPAGSGHAVPRSRR